MKRLPFRKIFGILAILIIAAILLLQIDDDLNPDIAGYLALAEPTGESQAYFYLLGIDAAEGEVPIEIGKQMIEAWHQISNGISFSSTEEFDLLQNPIPNRQKLSLPPDGDVFCLGFNNDCAKIIFNKELDITKILSIYAVQLARYKTFLKLTDFQELPKPSQWLAAPHNYGFLLSGNRLLLLEALSLAKEGQAEQGLSLLLGALEANRLRLEKLDSLIGRMISAALISHTLDYLSLFVRQQNISLDQKIPQLSLAERSFEKAMAYEFKFANMAFQSIDELRPDFFMSKLNDSWIGPKWWGRLHFKNNMSANTLYKKDRMVIVQSELEPSAFSHLIEQKPTGSSMFEGASIRNFAGDMLLKISLPQYEEYVANFFDLNAKIAIFNQTINKTELPSDLDYIQNPYYNKGGTAYYSEDGKQICLTGPVEDKSNRRCLRVKI